MYTLVNTVIRPYDISRPIQSVDTGGIAIRSLISDNDKVYLVLTNDFIEGHLILDLDDVAEDIYNKEDNITVDQWLVLMGNITLPTFKSTIDVISNRVKTMDTFEAGFHVKTSTGRLTMDDENTIDDDLLDITIYKDDIDHRALGGSSLVSVGGYLHLVDYDQHALYVKGGNITARRYGSIKTNLLSFMDVGKITQIPISQCTLTPTFGHELYKGVDISSPIDLTNKSVFLSIGGHLLTQYKSFTLTGTNTVSLAWRDLEIPYKYLKMRKILDTTSVDELINGDDDLLDKEDFRRDDVIEAFLHLSQSFIIVIDNPSVTTLLTRIEPSGITGKYFVYGDPHRTTVSSDMRIIPRSLIDEHKCWVLSTSVEEGRTPNYYQYKTNPDDIVFLPHLMDAKQHRNTALYQLDITSTHIEISE